MKGQSPIVTHSILVLFAVVLLMAVVTSMGNIEKNYRNFTSGMSAKSICSLLKSTAEKIYVPVSGNITVNRTIEMGHIIISLPTRIGNGQYVVSFYNNSVLIEYGKISYGCNIGTNATLSGLTYGGRTKIKWMLGNGTNSLTIENE